MAGGKKVYNADADAMLQKVHKPDASMLILQSTRTVLLNDSAFVKNKN